MMLDEDQIEATHRLMGDLSDSINRTGAAFFGRKADEDGLELVGKEIAIFMAAIGPLFVRIAIDMGMTKSGLIAAVEGSWEHAAGDCDCGEAH